MTGIEHECDPPDAGRDLPEHLQRLAANDVSMSMKPVIFPPGRGKLATKPEPAGSAETITNTIGIVHASRWRQRSPESHLQQSR
jgi:hypothetical protein